MASFGQVEPLIGTAAEGLGFEFLDARLFGAGGRSVLRVTIDKDGGVSIADCEQASGAIGAMLDEQDFFGGKPYTLEVSSPGIDRPLTTERDFARVTGKEVTLNLSVPVNGKKCLRGKIISCADGKLNMEIKNDSVIVPLADILSGKEEVTFK